MDGDYANGSTSQTIPWYLFTSQSPWYDNSVNNNSINNNTNNSIKHIDGEVISRQDGILSAEFSYYSTLVIYSACNGLLALFGIAFNVINIVVFWKQGFADSINVSLFSLAVADLMSLTTALCISLGYGIWAGDLVKSINFRHVQYITAAYPHGMFARIGSFITAYISMERCLCVLVPLKVKGILTKRFTSVTIVSIYVTIMGSFVIVFYHIKLAPQFVTSLNATVIMLAPRHQESLDVETAFQLVISLMQLAAFVLVVIFTLILIIKMNSKNKWRQKSLTSGQAETMSTRDQRVIKMVMVICVTFVMCYTPPVVQMISTYAIDVYHVRSRHHYMFVFIWSLCIFSENVCSSINIFYYFRMSSRYASVLGAIMPCRFFKKHAEEKK